MNEGLTGLEWNESNSLINVHFWVIYPFNVSFLSIKIVTPAFKWFLRHLF